MPVTKSDVRGIIFRNGGYTPKAREELRLLLYKKSLSDANLAGGRFPHAEGLLKLAMESEVATARAKVLHHPLYPDHLLTRKTYEYLEQCERFAKKLGEKMPPEFRRFLERTEEFNEHFRKTGHYPRSPPSQEMLGFIAGLVNQKTGLDVSPSPNPVERKETSPPAPEKYRVKGLDPMHSEMLLHEISRFSGDMFERHIGKRNLDEHKFFLEENGNNIDNHLPAVLEELLREKTRKTLAEEGGLNYPALEKIVSHAFLQSAKENVLGHYARSGNWGGDQGEVKAAIRSVFRNTKHMLRIHALRQEVARKSASARELNGLVRGFKAASKTAGMPAGNLPLLGKASRRDLSSALSRLEKQTEGSLGKHLFPNQSGRLLREVRGKYAVAKKEINGFRRRNR
ncbi:MAG: hypothetical protein WC792_06150 [Candidatus Micrarchaeia archaeon]|jgi:hypothetical protein